MKHYAGIDVSLEASSVCVVDAEGRLVREDKVLSEPEALIAWFRDLAAPVERIGLEAGPLSQWLHAAMATAGLPVELLETGDVAPYQKSKTLSERAAWDFIAKEGAGLELSAVNPTTVVGPALGPDISHSIRLIKTMLDGQPGCPKINSCFVDVRDVADLHLRAMTDPAAKGERFLAAAGDSMWMVEVAKLLKERLGDAARKVSTRQLPNWMVRLAAQTNPAVRGVLPMLGLTMNATSEKAISLLDWRPQSREDAIVAAAESLVRLGMAGGA